MNSGFINLLRLANSLNIALNDRAFIFLHLSFNLASVLWLLFLGIRDIIKLPPLAYNGNFTISYYPSPIKRELIPHL